MSQAPPPGTKVISRSVYVYQGQDIDQGQIFETQGCVNDEALDRLGYFVRTTRGGSKPAECGVCSAKFVDARLLHIHGEKRHPDRFNDQLEEDRMEAEQNRLMQESPLRLDRSAATLNG